MMDLSTSTVYQERLKEGLVKPPVGMPGNQDHFLCQAFRLDLPYRRYRSCLLRIRYFSGYRPDQTGYRHT